MRRIQNLVAKGSRKVQAAMSEQGVARSRARRLIQDLFRDLSPLEERVLMTTTITSANWTNYLDSGNFSVTDQDGITIDSGVVITTTGGSITLAAPCITIQSGVNLISSGGNISVDGTALWAGGNTKSVVHPNNQGVTLGSNVVISASNKTGHAGAIELSSTGVGIGANSSILAIGGTDEQDGSITISANNVMKGFNLNALNQFENFIRWFQNQSATINVGAGVDIEGGEVSISAESGNKMLLEGWSSLVTPIVSAFALELLHKPDLFSLPLTVQVWKPLSTIDLEAGAVVKSSEGTEIEATAEANAFGKAIWNSLMFGEKTVTGKLPFGFAIGEFYTDANATITLAGNAQIQSGGSIGISTTVNNAIELEAKAVKNTGSAPTKENNVAVAWASSQLKTTSVIDLQANSTVSAQGNVTISASATDINEVGAKAASYHEGLVTAGGAFAWTDANVQVIVNGTVESAVAPTGSLDATPQIFNPSFAVNFSNSSLNFTTPVTYTTGQPLTFDSSDGSTIPGLAPGSTYYAIVNSAYPNQLQLAATLADAQAGTEISFGAGYPTLSVGNTAVPITLIDSVSTNTIQFGYSTAPDGLPLFQSGRVVTYTPMPGKFIGMSDTSGNLLGALPAGQYTVQELKSAESADFPLAIQLLDSSGNVIVLNTNSFFTVMSGTGTGTIYQVASVDIESSQIDFNFPTQEANSTTTLLPLPVQTVSLSNGQQIQFTAGFSNTVANLVTGQTYYAVVNSSTPGVINVATTAAQAAAANPAVQDALAQLQSVDIQAFVNSVASNFATTTNNSTPPQTSTLQVQSNNSYKLWNNATTGTFTLNVNTPYGVQTTPALAWNITASALQAALVALGGLVPTVTGSGTEASPWVISSLFQFNVGNFEPGTGLVFDSNPLLADGSPVIYQAVPGKPVPGLTDGATYYVYSQTNPYFSSSSPQYILSLHATTDASAAAVDFSNTQTITDSNGLTYGFASLDTTSNQITLNLPVAAPITDVNNAQLTGGTTTLLNLTSGATQIMSMATSGSFTLTVQVGANALTTTSLPYNASAAQLQSALNALSGVNATVTGQGTISNPWMIIGIDSNSITTNSSQLLNGTNPSNLLSQSVSNASQLLWTTATGGSFVVTLDVNGQSVSTASLSFNATAAQVEAALIAIGQVGASVTGAGTQNDPWLIVSVYQSIQTGDALIFNDAWGEYNMGLVNGQTYYAVVSTSQSDPQLLALSLAPSYAEAVAASPTLVNMQDYLLLESANIGTMTGAPVALSTAPSAASGVNITAKLVTDDSASFKSQIGGYPLGKMFLQGQATVGDQTVPKTVLDILAKTVPGGSADRILAGSQLDLNVGKSLPFGGSQAFALVDARNTSQVIIGSTAVIESVGAVNIKSTIDQVVHTNSDARLTKSQGKNKSVEIGIALDMALIENTSRAIVQSNAVIDGGAGVNVNSVIEYPFAWQHTNIAAFHNNDATNKALQGTALAANIAKNVLFSNAFGVSKWLFNNSSNVASGHKNSEADKQIIAFTLNATVVCLSNTNLAQICDGAQINQSKTIGASINQGVSVTADTTVDQISVAGQFGLSLNLATLWMTALSYKNGETNSRLLFNANPAGYALGGAVNFASMDNSTQALIGGANPDLGEGAIDNVQANATQPTRINFGNGGLDIDAQTEVTYIQICQSGGKSTNMGFAGSLAMINVGEPNNPANKQVTNAAILSAALPPVIQANNGTTGDISITANDDTSLVSATGGFLAGASKNLGLSGSLIFLTRDVTAAISPSNLSETAPPASTFNLAGNITIASSAGGSVVPVSIVGAYTTNNTGGGSSNNNGGSGDYENDYQNTEQDLEDFNDQAQQDVNDPIIEGNNDLNNNGQRPRTNSVQLPLGDGPQFDLGQNINRGGSFVGGGGGSFFAPLPAGPNDGADNPLQGDNKNDGVKQAASQTDGTWGLGISGDFSGAWVTDNVTSIINDSGHFIGQAGGVIRLSSLNETLVEGISGSAAIISMGGSPDASVAASGSVAIVNVTSNVTSQINHANIDGFGLDVTAENKKVIGSFSGGMQVAVVPTTSVNVDGSISYNTITNDTVAQLNDVTGTDIGQVVVDATAADRDWASGGMLTVSWDKRDAAAENAEKPKTSVGIGVSGAMNTIVNNTFAQVLGSSIEQTSGEFDVNATDLTHSFVFSSGLNMTVAAGISVNIGGMFATANMTANTQAVVENSTINNNSSESDAGFQANALFVPMAVSIAGYVSAEYGKAISEKANKVQVGVGAAVVVTNIQGSNYAGASNSTISMSGGDIQFVANSIQPSADPAYQQFFDNTPSNNIYSLAIVGSAQGESSVGNAVGVPVGGAVIVVQTAIATQAQVDGNSTLTTPGNVAISALENLSVKTDAGGAIAGLQVADGVSVDVAIGTAINAFNSNNSISSSISDSNITTGQSLSVNSKKSTTVDSIGFGVAVNAAITTAGVGFAASVSGAFVFNTCTDTIESFITGGTLNIGDSVRDGLTVSALDETAMTTSAGAGSGAFAYGTTSSWGIAPSVVVGENNVTNQIRAFVGSKDSNTTSATVVNVSGPVSIEATGSQTLQALTVAAAVSVSVSAGLGVGFAGAGAGSSTTTNNNMTAGILYGTQLNSGMNSNSTAVSVKATDQANITSIVGSGAMDVSFALDGILSFGGSIGLSISEITNNDNVNALIEGANITTKGGDVVVQASGNNTHFSESVATSLSVSLWALAAAGGNSNIYDNANFTASVDSGSAIVTGNSATGYGNLSVLAETSETVMAQMFGGAGSVGSIGVFMSNATRSGSTLANLVTNGTISVGNLAVKATTNQTVTSEGMSVTIGLLAGTGETHRLGINENVQTNVNGSGNTWVVSGNLSIGSSSTNNATAQTSGAKPGQQDVSIAGLGVGFYKVVSAVNPVVSTSINNANLVVTGSSSLGTIATSENSATARSGSGSLVGGDAARAITDNSPNITFSTSNLQLSSASATFLARNCGTYNTNANSVYATAVGGSTGRAYNTSVPNLLLNLGSGTLIHTNGSVIVKAENDITGLGDASDMNGGTGGIMVRMGAGSIAGGAWGDAESCLTANSAISLGANVSINANGQGSKILIGSSQGWNTNQLTYMHDSSGFGGGNVKSLLTSCLTNNISLGSNVSLTAPAGSIGIGTSINSQTTADTYSYVFEVGGSSKSYANNSQSACQSVSIGNNSLLRAAGDISVTSGYDPVSGAGTLQDTYAIITAKANGGVVFTTEACATSNSKMNVNTGPDSQIISDRDVDLGVLPGINDAACYTFSQKNWRDGKTDSGTNGATVTSDVSINGNVTAGYTHQLAINIPQTGNTATVNGQTVDLANISSSLTNVKPQGESAFVPFQASFNKNYNATSLLNGLDETSCLILSKSISSTPVNAVTLANLAATGGQVVIHANTSLSGTGTISAFSPNITVNNNSPAYLLLDGINIPNTLNMGKVTVVGSAGLPVGMTLNQQIAGPSININQLYNHQVGTGTTSGPAIGVIAPIVNTGGSVAIYNACGALAQDAAINSMSLTISTPNSAYIVNTPQSYLGTGGTISDYWTNSSQNLVQNSSFENPACGTGNFVYDPVGASWTFSVSSGVSGNNSGFTSGNPNAPAGSQVAFVQESGVISQTITGLTAGQSYTVSFYAAQRAGYFSSSTYQELTVTLGSTTLVSGLKPSSTNYQQYTYTFTPSISGNQTLTFTGLEPTSQDETVFLDQVMVTPVTTNFTPGLNSYVYQYTANLAATTAADVLYLGSSGATNSTAFSNWLYNTGTNSGNNGIGVGGVDFVNTNVSAGNPGSLYPKSASDNWGTQEYGTGIIFFGSEVPYLWQNGSAIIASGSSNLTSGLGYFDTLANAQYWSVAASGNPANSYLNVTQGTGPQNDNVNPGRGIYPVVPSTFPTNATITSPQNIKLGDGITAGQLDITALYIDINAPVNLGVSNAGFQANLSASLGSYIKSQLADNLSVACIPIPDSYLGGSNTSLTAYYDVAANQIVLCPVAINAGVVSAIFKGGIISTTSQGKITVSSNAGQNQIDNQTGYPLVIQGIEASESQLAGIVQFNDTLTNLSTAFVYRGSNVEKYQGALGPDHGAKLSQLQLVSSTFGATASFTPSANLAYQWEEQAFISRNLSFTNYNNSYNLNGSSSVSTTGTVNDNWAWGPLGTSGSAPATYTSAVNPFKQGNALLLTNGTNDTANAYWYQSKVNIPTSGSFTVRFNYRASGNKAADGLTLAFQNQGTNAVGNTGGALGYQGIVGNTAAYQINLYNAGGQHIPGSNFVKTNTTGTYHSTGNVNYTSGDWISVQLVYDADTQTVTENLKDLSTSATYQNVYENIDLASVLGSEAYIGFTGGEGGATSIQVVTDFSLTGPNLTLNGFDNWVNSAPGGVVTLSTANSNYTEQISATMTQSETATTYFSSNYQDAWNYGPSTQWTWTYPTEILLQIKNQLPACNPISIDFSGVQYGFLNINSGSSVVLDGNIQFPGVVNLYSGGDISLTSGAVIDAYRLGELTANGAIGNTTSPLNLNTYGGFSDGAQATTGIYLSSNQSLTIGGVMASNGPVVLQSNGSLVSSGDSRVSGTAISLLAANGSVGSQSQPIAIQTITTTLPTGSITGGLLTASAADAVYVTQSTGDLRIGSVTTTSPIGVVSITAANGNITDGNIPDAFGLNTGNLSTSMIEHSIRSIGLRQADSSNLAIASFEGSVDSSYLQYWTAVENGTVANGSLTLSSNGVNYYQANANSYYANTANQTSNATVAQVNSYANMLYDNSVSVFENSMAFGPEWATLPQFQVYNANYTFTASNATISALSYRAADPGNAFALLSLEALSPQGSSLLGNSTSPAIKTAVLQLNAGGSIGLTLDPVEIDFSSIQSGHLTPYEKTLLALATTAGELKLVGTGVDGQQFIFPYGSEPANVTITGVVVKIEKPLFVDVANNGLAMLQANGSISLSETTGNLNVLNATSQNNIRLASQNDLLQGQLQTSTTASGWSLAGNGTLGYSAAGTGWTASSLTLTNNNPTGINAAHHLQLTSGGDIGSAASPVQIVAGQSLGAYSTGNLTLKQVSGDLSLASVEAGGSVQIDVGGNISNTDLSLPVTKQVLSGFDGWVAAGANTSVSASSLTLSDGVNNDATAYWNQQMVDIPTTGTFTIAFDYQSAGDRAADGITLALQTAGTNAIGGSGGSLGYTGISGRTAAYQINLYNAGGTHIPGSNFVTTNSSGSYLATGNVSFNSGDTISVTLVFDADAQTVTETLKDLVTSATFQRVYQSINLASAVGSKAYIGFTGGDGGATSVQTVKNFSLATTTSNTLLKGTIGGFGGNGTGWTTNSNANSSAVINNNILTLGDSGTTLQASSAWMNQVSVVENGFIASFVYKGQGSGNGLTFTLQNDARKTNAIGDAGPALGYGTAGLTPQIQPSLAWQLNIGADPNATTGIGLNRNGNYGIYEQPGTFNMNTNHPIQVVLTYSPGAMTFSQTLTDTVTGETYSSSFTNINLLKLLGSSKALIGFTGSGPAQTVSDFYFCYGAPTIKAADLVLSSSGQIGSSNSPILMLASGAVNATAPNGIYLLQTNGNLFVNSVTSQANVALSAPTGSVVNNANGSVQSSSLTGSRQISPGIRAASVVTGGITANLLQLNALWQLGSAVKPLATSVNSISACNTIGNIVVENTGLLNIGDGSPQNGIQSGGAIAISSDLGVEVNSPVVATGEISLKTTSNYLAGSHIRVNPGSTIESALGGVYLSAGAGVIIATGARVQSNAVSGNAVVELTSSPVAGGDAMSSAIESHGTIVADTIRLNSGDISTRLYLALGGILGKNTSPTLQLNAGSGYDTLTLDSRGNRFGQAVSIADGAIQSGNQKLLLSAIDSVILELGDGNDQVKVGDNLPLDQLQIFTNGGGDSVETTLSPSNAIHQLIDTGTGSDNLRIDAAGQNAWASTGLLQSWDHTIQHNATETITLKSATTLNAMPALYFVTKPATGSIDASNRQYIDAAFQQVLNRSATSSELDRWAGMLDRRVITRLQLATKLTNSDEARLLRVNAWYLNYFGRPATQVESKQALRRMHSGQIETRILTGILSNPEFFGRTQSLASTGFSRDRFITSLYKLAIDPSGTPTPALHQFLNRLYQTRGRTAVVMNILQSAPATQNQAEALSILINQAPATRSVQPIRLGQNHPKGLQAILLSRK